MCSRVLGGCHGLFGTNTFTKYVPWCALQHVSRGMVHVSQFWSNFLLFLIQFIKIFLGWTLWSKEAKIVPQMYVSEDWSQAIQGCQSPVWWCWGGGWNGPNQEQQNNWFKSWKMEKFVSRVDYFLSIYRLIRQTDKLWYMSSILLLITCLTDVDLLWDISEDSKLKCINET